LANHRNEDPEKTLEARSITPDPSHTIPDSTIGSKKDYTICSNTESSRTFAPSGDSTIADFEAPPASPPLPSVPGYVIEGVLGRGGMGVVYRARHLALNRPVALKMVLAGIHAGPDERARFRTETEAVARLQHPNIVQIYEIGEANGHPYCALEYLAGGTLADQMKSSAISPGKAARLLEPLARAVQTAHDKSVIHRDLKPANILMTADGTPKIADFGLARQTDRDSGQTQSGAVMGSPSYMAPEQASGRSREAGPGVDIWALGVILYECLAGRPPFRGDSVVETLELVRSADPVPPSKLNPKLPVDLETICLKALAKEPSRRYATAAELADDLQRFLNDEPILARRAGLAERLWRRARRNAAVVGLTATVLALTAIVAVSATRPKPVPPVPVVAAPPETDDSSEELLTVVAELDRSDPGWRTEQIEEKRKEIPDDQNGALRITAFQKAMQELTGDPHSIGDWQKKEVIDALNAAYAESPALRLTRTEELALFRAELERMSRPLEIARSLAALPNGRVPIKLKRNAISTLLPDHQTGRYMANLLRLDALVQIADGNRAAALTDSLAILNLGQAFSEDPMIVAQLVRAAVLRLGIEVAQRLVSQLDCTDGELEQLQRALDRSSAEPVLLTALRGERGLMHDFLSAIEAGDVPSDTLKNFGSNEKFPLPSPREARLLHIWALRYLTEFVAIARQPSETWQESIRQLDERLPTPPKVEAEAIHEILLESSTIGNYARGINMMLAALRTASTGMAVARYRLAHHEWPADLGKLVPGDLKEIPKDPFDGQPLRYRRTPDGVVIYSVGEDLNDNQGTLARTFDQPKEGMDPGFRLFDKPQSPKETPK
jgi:hypothetical protein